MKIGDAAVGSLQYGFFAKRTAAQAVASGSDVTVQCNTVSLNNGSYYNNTTFQHTPPAGWYRYEGGYEVTNFSQGNAVYIKLFKNGNEIAYEFETLWTGFSGLKIMTISRMLVADGDDYFELRINHNKGSDVNLQADTGTENVFFSGYKLFDA